MWTTKVFFEFRRLGFQHSYGLYSYGLSGVGVPTSSLELFGSRGHSKFAHRAQLGFRKKDTQAWFMISVWGHIVAKLTLCYTVTRFEPKHISGVTVGLVYRP